MYFKLYQIDEQCQKYAMDEIGVQSELSPQPKADGDGDKYLYSQLEALSDAISSGSYSVVADSGTSTTVVDATYGSYGDDFWRGCLLVCLSATGSIAGQARPVVDFATTSGTFTVYPPFNAPVQANDAFVLISGWKFAEWITMPDVAVNITSTDDAETNVFDLSTAGNSYRVNSLRIKSADPTGTDVVKVRLYELINDVSTEVDSFEITTSNYGTYFSLFDMFGTTHLSGDNLKITVQTTTGTTHVAVTGQYSYEKAYSA